MDSIEIHLGKGMRELREKMEEMMDEMFQVTRPCLPRTSTCWAPPIDIYETRAELLILAELAGVKKEEIQLVMDHELLQISGRRANPIQEAERRFHQMEIDFGPFERRIRIRVPIVLDGVKAVYRDGFLLIHLPKASPVNREIQVHEVE